MQLYNHQHRFPLKDEARLQKWEQAVRRVRKDRAEWKATHHSFICSNHFERYDYTLPPSATGTCRLKKNAIPTLFKIIPESTDIPKDARSRVAMPEELTSNTRKRRMPQMSSPAAKVLRTHNATKSHLTNKALKKKVKNLQQQLRRSKKKIGNMADIINNLQDDLVIKSKIADRLHTSFNTLQLSIFHNAKNNTTISPTGRRYTDDIKEFALTLYLYSPKAYQYVRSIIPLPNPSLTKKWSSSVDCEPGFLAEAFKSLETEVKNSPTKKDCCLIIDAMAIRK